MMKNNSGVTLIALVITIIVLLILAGVSIATLMGPNGIITNAKQAEIDNAQGEFKEAVGVAISELEIEKREEKDPTFTATEVLDKAKINNPRFATGTGKESTVAEDTGNTIVYTFKGKTITATIEKTTGKVTMSKN